jgi:hypothetical protein
MPASNSLSHCTSNINKEKKEKEQNDNQEVEGNRKKSECVGLRGPLQTEVLEKSIDELLHPGGKK